MISPHTPILQTSGSWGRLKSSPPPITTIPTPPPRNSVRRKPVPQRLGIKAIFEYSPPNASPINPVVPLDLGAKARDKLNIEREYVQCMVCRKSSFLTCTAELVCSHHVHPRCLQQFVTTNNSSGGDAYPPCQICKYPAKPKDHLLNQHIRTALLRFKQLESCTTPPRSVCRPQRNRSSSVYSLDASPAPSSGTPTMTLATADPCDAFQPFQNRIPIQLSVKPVIKALSITANDPSCQFLVTVSCPDNTIARIPHQLSTIEEQISSRTAVSFAELLELSPSDFGNLRFERRFEYSSDGKSWMTVRTLLFEHALILASCDVDTPILYTDISANLLSASLMSSPQVSVCVELKLQSMSRPVYLTSNNHEHLFSFIAAISDKSLSFPLTRNNLSLSLQSPFIGDYIHCLPCHAVVCIPESFPLNILAETVGRMRVFDRIGVVHYGSKTTTYSLSRQSWQRWQSLFEQESSEPVLISEQPSSSVLLSASRLFKSDEKAARSIILLNDAKGQIDDPTCDIPVYCVGVGENSNDSVLSRISANTGGHYVHSERDKAAQYITNMVFGDQALTHENVNITLKPRKGTLSGVSGYGMSPGESSSTINENSDGNLVVKLGRLRAGQTRSFIASVDIDSSILKYTYEGSELDILEVIGEASMANCTSSAIERRNGRINIELHDAPANYFSGLHAQVPITSNDRLETLSERLVLATAASLDRVAKLVQNNEHSLAVALIHKMIENLERAAGHISLVYKCATKSEADLVLNCSTIIEILLSNTQFLRSTLTQKSTLASLYNIIWTLRSGRSFSRNSGLEAIYFDSNKLNVI